MQIDQPNVRRSAPAQARNALAAEIDQALFGGCDLRGFDEYVEIAHHASAESFPRRREQVSGAFRQRRLDARAVECRQQLVQLCQQARVSLDIVIVDVAQERGDIMRQMVQLLAFRERDANGWREPVAVCARKQRHPVDRSWPTTLQAFTEPPDGDARLAHRQVRSRSPTAAAASA